MGSRVDDVHLILSRVADVDCPAGFVGVDSSCLLLSSKALPFIEADAVCRANGAHLLDLPDSQTVVRPAALLKRTHAPRTISQIDMTSNDKLSFNYEGRKQGTCV